MNSSEQRVRELCASAQSPMVMTGAGISAESGVPTFRGQGGLWKTYKAEDLATPEAFQRDPKLVWEWYGMRRRKIADVLPNPGHVALADWQAYLLDSSTKSSRSSFRLVTQNVDDLHERAGSQDVIHLHGSLWRVHCSSCGVGGLDMTIPYPASLDCTQCGGRLRPSVVWFGESLGARELQDSIDGAHHCDLFLVIGTSGLVHPAASFAGVARERGAQVIEVNLEETPLSSVAHHSLFGPAGEILPRILPKPCEP